MGAPKQKWTAEEEAALKAGVVKHGAGKWRTILKDPEFSGILCLRSNVDLKDKWRNISVTASGWGSREKARIALKKSKQVSKHDDNPMALSTIVKDINDEIVHAKPLAVSSESLRIAGPKGSNSRLENLIVEAITTLEEPTGSNKTAIAMYIEDQYWPPPDFKRLLSAKLKALTASGKLIKVGSFSPTYIKMPDVLDLTCCGPYHISNCSLWAIIDTGTCMVKKFGFVAQCKLKCFLAE